MKVSRKIGAAAVVSAVAAAIMLNIPAAQAAKAEDESLSVELSPVQASGDIAYNYFDAPTAVHAEPSGIHVSCSDGVVSVTVEQENGLTFSEPKSLLADKAYKNGECFITLNDGAIYSYYGIDTEPVEYEGFSAIDFDVASNTVYAVGADKLSVIPITDDALDLENAYTVELYSSTHKNISVKSIAATESGVFVALSSSTAPYKQDIAAVDKQSGALSTVLLQSDEIMSLTVMSHSDTVYALTRDRITGYAISGGMLKQKYVSHDARMTDIYAYDGYIYAIDTLGALYRVSGDLQTYTVLAASASSEEGFFNSPAGAAVKNSTLFVADPVNNRIAQYGDGVTYITNKYNYPVSVACDSKGTLYVAHDLNKVSYANEEFTVDGFIKQIAVDADKRIYVLSDAGLWAYDSPTAYEKISDTAYKAISLGIGRDELYALDDESVYKFTENEDGSFSSTAYCTAPAAAYSFAVDFKSNVYLLSADGVTRVDKEGAYDSSENIPLALYGKPYGVEGGQILLSTVGNGYVDYGSAIIVDTFKHRVFSASGDSEALDIKLIDGEDYEVPDHANDRTAEYYGEGLIRTALYDVSVFSLPIETPEVYLIKRGRKVIVPEYDLDDTHEFSLVLVDDAESHKLVQGYVYKDALSDALAYTTPPANAVSPFSGATPVYKWPSPHSPTLSDYSPVLKGDTLYTIEFVDDYRDYKNNLWYRVYVGDDFEGYMMAADVSLGEYETTRIRPAYNAKIISYKNSEYAQAYLLKNGVYMSIDIKLDTGTEVEVVGAFDSTERYTKIKCLTELGTVTCYVETVYIDYDGVNIVLLVAIVVIIITVVLAAIIIARVFYLKKKRLTTPDDSEDTANRR